MRVPRSLFNVCIVFSTILCGVVDAAPLQPRELNTDRDAFTPSTFTIRPGFALNEMSHVYIQNRDGNPTNNYPEYLCRIGANDVFEWRLGVNYSVGSQGNVVTSVEAGELPIGGNALYESNFLYGFKLATTNQDGLIPQSCFIMEATTPMYGEEFGTEPVATIVCGWEFPEKWRLDAAMAMRTQRMQKDGLVVGDHQLLLVFQSLIAEVHAGILEHLPKVSWKM